MAFVLAAPTLPTRRPGQQTGSKRLKWASLNHAGSHREEPENPYESRDLTATVVLGRDARSGLSRRRSRVRVSRSRKVPANRGSFAARVGTNDRPASIDPALIPHESRVLQRLFVLMRRRSSLPSRADPAGPLPGPGGAGRRTRRAAGAAPLIRTLSGCRSGRPMARCEPAGAWREAGGGRRSRRRAARDRASRRRRFRKPPTRSLESGSWAAM